MIARVALAASLSGAVGSVLLAWSFGLLVCMAVGFYAGLVVADGWG